MPRQTEFDKRIQAEVTRLQEKEAEKRFLYDRTVGGENVPRPTPECIEKCVGPLKSEAQIRQEAQIAVEKQQLAERLAAQRQRDVQQSMEQRQNQAQEQQRQTKDHQVNDLAQKFAQARDNRSRGNDRQR